MTVGPGLWKILALIIVFLFGSNACIYAADGIDKEDGFSGEIILGATFPRSGYLETYGQSAYYGAETRVRMINDAGGINGKKLVLVWRDNRSDPHQAVLDVREFAEKYKVPAILGPLLSDATMAVGQVAEELGVVIMTPMATVDAATRGNNWIFRSCFTNSAQIEGLVRFQMEKFGAVTAGILYDPRHATTSEQVGIFEKEFSERGGILVGRYPLVNSAGEVDFEVPLVELGKKRPDFIFAPCYALEATELIQAAKKLEVNIRFAGPDTWDNELVFDGSGSRLTGTSFASTLFEQAFSYRPFRDFYAAMELAGMDNPDAPAACAYDAVTLLADALKSGETAEAVRTNLFSVKRKSLATGRVTITSEGDTVKPVLIRIVEIIRSRLVPVYAERYDP